MKLWPFSRKEVKGRSEGRFTQIQGLPPVQWSPQTAEALTTDGYQKCVIVARCVQVIAQGTASIPIKLSVNGKEQEKHAVLDLLNNPNPRQGHSTFIEEAVSFLKITGNSYVEIIKAGSKPKELWCWQPYHIKVKQPSKGMIPTEFIFDDGIPAHTRSWDVDRLTGYSDLLQLKTFNPRDYFCGLSQIVHSAFAIDQHNAASEWNMRMLQNCSVPTGALMSKQSLTEGQFNIFKKELEETYQGATNARRPMILSGDLTWVQMALSAMEMDWLNGKKVSAMEIAAAFGVPLQVIPIEGSQTFANYEQARQACYQDTVIPFAKTFWMDMSRWFSAMYDEKIEIIPDVGMLEATAPSRNAQMTSLESCKFMTINEKRKIMGLPPITDTPDADRLMSSNGSPLPTAGEKEELERQAKEEANQDMEDEDLKTRVKHHMELLQIS